MFQYKDNRFHPDLITDPLAPRLKVDVGQTGFFAGREFRTFQRIDIAAGSQYVIKAVVDSDIILLALDVTITSGNLELETRVGGTEGGVFGGDVPIFRANNTSTSATPAGTVTLSAGGTHTGGTVLDLLLDKTDANANRTQTVGAAQGGERGIGAGTYYFAFNALLGAGVDAVSGVFKARWQIQP